MEMQRGGGGGDKFIPGRMFSSIESDFCRVLLEYIPLLIFPMVPMVTHCSHGTIGYKSEILL